MLDDTDEDTILEAIRWKYDLATREDAVAKRRRLKRTQIQDAFWAYEDALVSAGGSLTEED